MAAGIAIAAYANRDRFRLKLASVYASVRPKAVDAVPAGRRRNAAFRGTGPWALSALPECFDQTDLVTGTRAYVLAHLAKNAQPATAPLFYADCEVLAGAGGVEVRRGADRLRVPAPAQLYVVGDRRVVVVLKTRGHYELRAYQTATGGPLRL